MNKKLLLIVVILLGLLLPAKMFFEPYNSVERNAGTIYYQSYSQAYVNVRQYVRMLENYNDTKNKKYLEHALIKLDAIRDNLTIFRLANQMDFRNTYINEKVVKTDFLTLNNNLYHLGNNYHYSKQVLESFLKGNKLDDKTFKDFLHYNQLILTGLTTEDVGYNSDTKEFRVVLDDSKRPLLEEGLAGLKEIVEKSTTSHINE